MFHFSSACVKLRVVIYVGLFQAAVIKQDSILELLQQEQEPAAGLCHSLGHVGANRETRAGSSTGELVLLQRQHSLLQEELLRLRDAENRFKDSEKARAKLEREVRHMRTCCREKTVQVNTLICISFRLTLVPIAMSTEPNWADGACLKERKSFCKISNNSVFSS